MILAAAACARGQGPPPPELMLGWEIERFHSLPEPGGLRDQIAGELFRCQAVLNVHAAFRALRSSGNWAKWAQANPRQNEIVARVLELQEEYANR